MLIVTTPTKYIKADDGARIMLGRNKNIIIRKEGTEDINIERDINGDPYPDMVPQIYSEEVKLFAALLSVNKL